MDRETTSWRERAAKARTEVQSKLHRPSTDAAPVRRLLTTDVEAAGAKLELTKDLLAKARLLVLSTNSALALNGSGCVMVPSPLLTYSWGCCRDGS